MVRAGQPSVLGHLLAGILLGPSVFGALCPPAYQTIFPCLPEQKVMIDAISQLGTLLLLLLTGMEMDWVLVKRTWRTPCVASLAGIIFPFICGFLLGQLLPDAMLPDPAQRQVTAFFLATALAISSIRIVAMVTELIGVHVLLGAFVAGLVIGQSPTLKAQIEEKLHSLVVALFAPVFFAAAGLAVDLRSLRSLVMLRLALGLIAIASFGKLAGCYFGGRVGGLSGREATALAFGMNARGSTEVIVASIGLSMGVLSPIMFTLLVVMALTTTMITTPLLR